MARSPYVSVNIQAAHPGRKISAQDLIASLQTDVAAGRLPAGCRLPPVRALERQLGLSKNTVQAAYDELCARGVLEAREREGVFVKATGPSPKPAASAHNPPQPRLRPVPALFQRTPPPTGAIALSTVLIDPELLPRERIADCVRSVLRQPGLSALYDFQGHPGLRAAIACRLQARGMDVSAAEILITVGSQQALDVVARALEVRRVAMENPVYPHGRLLFESHGLAITGLSLSPFEGIDLDRWESSIRAKRPGLLYAITSFQNPTGYSYSSFEIERLLELAARHDMALLEDDWGSDMLSDGEYRPGLRLHGGPNVLYMNAFTKKLLPSLRVGFLVAPAALMPSLVAARRLSTLGGAWLIEAAVNEFLERGYYDTHLKALQAALDHRYLCCLDKLRQLMPATVKWTTPGGGPTLWLEIPGQVNLGLLASALARRSVFVEDTSPAFFGQPHLHGFRVSYAYLPEETLTRALEILADELHRAGA